MKHLSLLITFFAVGLCSGCVNGMFYFPTQETYNTPARQGLPYESVRFPSHDGTELSGWFIPAVGKAKGTVLHFHGNAQNMTAHFTFVRWLPAEGFNVFTFDYRGYGESAGSPDREGIYHDCLAAVKYVQGRPDVDPDKIVTLGQSLGGAYAIVIMTEEITKSIKGVAVDSAFFSYRLIVRDKIATLPVLSLLKWPLSFLIVSNRYSPDAAIDKISPIPVIFFHGSSDQTIPYKHGVMLFDKAQEPKEFVLISQGRHADAFIQKEPTYRNRLVDFYETALGINSKNANKGISDSSTPQAYPDNNSLQPSRAPEQ